jgi:hypothetical protein
MDEKFTIALRELLVEQAQTGPRRSRLRWPRRWSARVGVVVALVAGGGGLAAATGVVLSSGVPGSQKITALASAVTITGDGTQTVQLGTPPAGANAIYTEFSCLTPGTFIFADGASNTCGSQADVSAELAHPTIYTLSLAPGQDSTTITAAPGERWRLTAIYATATTTPWKVNARGQTYGTPNQNGTPDLIAAIATNGRSGYVYAKQLLSPLPTTSSQAVAQNHQGPRTLTVYESDGKTPIGQFITGK